MLGREPSTFFFSLLFVPWRSLHIIKWACTHLITVPEISQSSRLKNTYTIEISQSSYFRSSTRLAAVPILLNQTREQPCYRLHNASTDCCWTVKHLAWMHLPNKNFIKATRWLPSSIFHYALVLSCNRWLRHTYPSSTEISSHDARLSAERYGHRLYTFPIHRPSWKLHRWINPRPSPDANCREKKGYLNPIKRPTPCFSLCWRIIHAWQS
jgi:hypothetical protein